MRHVIILSLFLIGCKEQKIEIMSELTMTVEINGEIQEDFTSYENTDFQDGYKLDFNYNDMSVPVIKSIVADTLVPVILGTWEHDNERDLWPLNAVIRIPTNQGGYSFPLIRGEGSSGVVTVTEVGIDYFNASMVFEVHDIYSEDVYNVSIELNNMPL